MTIRKHYYSSECLFAEVRTSSLSSGPVLTEVPSAAAFHVVSKSQ